MEGQLTARASNPLKCNLGFFDFVKYTTVADEENFTFVKINKMWNEPIEAELDSRNDNSNNKSNKEKTPVQELP
jgi:hypothetical protein